MGKVKRHRDCCAICGFVFPHASAYGEERYEQILVNHMMICSTSPAAAAATVPPVAAVAPAKKAAAPEKRRTAPPSFLKVPPSARKQTTRNAKPPAKIYVTDDRKPVAVKRALPTMSPRKSEFAAAASHSAKNDIDSTKPSATTLGTNDSPGKRKRLVAKKSRASNDSTKPSATTLDTQPRKTKRVANKRPAPYQSPCFDNPSATTPRKTKRVANKRPAPNQSPPSYPDDTATTAVVTPAQDESSSSTNTISVSSTHFLAQTWWREKTVRRNPQVSMPFSLESCVATAADSNDTSNEEEVPSEARRRLRSGSRPRSGSLAMSCPICRKSFTSFLSIVTEDSMSEHVERCSKKFMSETAPASRRSRGSGSSSSSNNNQVAMASNLAVVAALSRPRNQETRKLSKEEKQQAENERQARRAAEWAARRASMHFLTYGAGEQALDEWVVGKGPDHAQQNGDN